MTKMQIDTDLIRELTELLKETELTEIEVADGDRRIRVVRSAMIAAAPPPPPPPPAAPIALPPTPAADRAGVVKSPMVGMVYTASEPGSPPFVKVGDKVSAGATLLIIEAMKVMNPIQAPHGGTVTEIFVENERPVEYGEPLLVIE